MDINQFTKFLSSLTASSSRRDIARAVGSLALGGALGASAQSDSAANKRRKRRRRRKKHGQNQPSPPPPHVCQGRNVCLARPISAARCSDDGNCFCNVTDKGQPICAKGNSVTSCAKCEQLFPGRICTTGGGPNCGAFGCVEECPL